MPYCTNCGASTEGAFCPQCGKPAGQAAGTAPPAASEPRRKSSVLVWILAGILGLGLVAGAVVFAGGLWMAHKAKEAGVDADLFRENPALAIQKLVAAVDPNADVIHTDAADQTVTVRDRRSGKEITLTFDQVKNRDFRLEADDGEDHRALIQAGDDSGGTVPAEVPVYPGAKVKSSFQVDGDGAKAGGAYEYEFSTPDTPAKILDYYHRTLEKAGMALEMQTHSDEGGMLVAQDPANRRTLRVIVGRDANGATINLTARVKR
ncbi:MAG TPA: zinc ribbon domain-containing protein [Bryobacteraceae bacterium]|nr:zinc ribbon domain-containing protein [Bryobacteraceae bacterium]